MAVLSKPKDVSERFSSLQLPAVLQDNPVARAEQNTLARTQRSRSRLSIIRYIILALVIPVAIVNIALVLASAFLRIPYLEVRALQFSLPQWTLLNLTTLLIFYTVITHFSRFFALISTAALGITREKRTFTWEMLALTGISARRVMWGKWWGAIHHHGRSFALLGLLQAGCMAFMMFGSARLYTPSGYEYAYPSLLMVLFGFALMLAYLVMDVGLNAACGVLAAMLRPAQAVSTALFVRGGLLIAMFMVSMWASAPIPTGSSLNSAGTPATYQRAPLLGAVLITQFEQGISVGTIYGSAYLTRTPESGVPDTTSDSNQRFGVDTLIVLAGLPLYAFFIWGALRLAELLAVRDGLTPASSRYPAQNSKVKHTGASSETEY